MPSVSSTIGDLQKLFSGFDKMIKALLGSGKTSEAQTAASLTLTNSIVSLNATLNILNGTAAGLTAVLRNSLNANTSALNKTLDEGSSTQDELVAQIAKLSTQQTSAGKTPFTPMLVPHHGSSPQDNAADIAADAALKNALDSLRDEALKARDVFKSYAGIDLEKLTLQDVKGGGTPSGDTYNSESGIDLTKLSASDVKGDAGKGPQWEPPTGPPPGDVAGAAGEEAGGSLAATLTEVSAAFIGVTLVAKAVSSALESLFKMALMTVEALSPADVRAFNFVLRNLMATIGTAFEPMIIVATNALQQISAVIAPLMRQLGPVIQDLSTAFVAGLMPIIKLLVAVIEPLLPILDFLAVISKLISDSMSILYLVFSALNPLLAVFNLILQPLIAVFKGIDEVVSQLSSSFGVVMVVVNTVFKTLLQWVASLFGKVDIKGFFDGLVKSIQKVTTYLILFIAELAKQMGSLDFVKNLKDNLSDQSSVAAGPTSIKSFDQISKDMATSSFGASGKGAEDENAWKKKLIEGLDKIIDDKEDSDSTLKDIKTLVHEISAAVKILSIPGAAATAIANPGVAASTAASLSAAAAAAFL